MAANLVSLVMQFLTPDMIGRIAAALGLDHNKVGSAITSAVPALLAALSNTATQPGGAQKLADAAKQQTSTLGNLASVLAGGGGSSLVEKGSQMLASFVGGPNQNALTDKFSICPKHRNRWSFDLQCDKTKRFSSAWTSVSLEVALSITRYPRELVMP